ncbi:Glycosyltransferase Family 90 domain containing protein [Tulasnella sp. JGI-2019a]|nr:Glycosyltransferase Family 90 domain containing protein [Tulasnella sp. JGI-2019a]
MIRLATAFIKNILRRLRRRLRRFPIIIIILAAFLILSIYTRQEKGPSTFNPPSASAHLSFRLRGVMTRPSLKSSSAVRSDTAHKLRYASDGLFHIDPTDTHPVLALMDSAEKEWQEKLSRSSKTLREAVVEYKRRYRRMPPKGFDQWWNFMIANNVQLPDEYDQINRDLAPFWGMKPNTLQNLQHSLQQKKDTFTLSVKGHSSSLSAQGEVTEGAEESASMRADAQLDVITVLEQWLPDFEATFSIHDAPQEFIDFEMRSHLEEKGLGGEDYMEEEEEGFDRRHLGWAAACPPSSPLRHRDPHQEFNVSTLWNQNPKSFIYDHRLTMDPCLHPSHAHLNGMLKNHGIGPMASEALYPFFTMCTSSLHSDILIVANEGWVEDVEDDPDWDEKTDERLAWRGRTTGSLADKQNLWKLSQRVRLVELTNRKESEVDVIRSPHASKSQQAQQRSSYDALDLKWANENLMDIGFVDEAIQCTEEICKVMERDLAFKPLMSSEEMVQYKYLMDIDGNGWSARFKRLMTTKSLVLKSTIFPEWYTDRVQPWVHYVPVKNDLTDLYDIMTFFRGNRDGTGSHDGLAKRIATQGRQWSLSFWRQEDMVAYMFRLYLEYARVMSKDRDEQSFTWDDLLAVEAANAPKGRRTGTNLR